jgi:hypothetical protein
MSDDGLSYEDLCAAMENGRALAAHFEEIKHRAFDLVARKGAQERSDAVGTNARSMWTPVEDVIALVGYLQLMLDENDKLLAFVMGLERAGTITRAELERLMGLRRG